MKKLILLTALIAVTRFAHSTEYVINHCPVTPVREEPAHAAEQATQLLFGEVCEVVDRHSSWTKIRSTMDGQVGWVVSKMLTPVSEEAIRLLGERREANGEGVVATPMAVATDTKTGEQLILTIGTRLPYYKKGAFEVLGKKYKINPRCVYEVKSEGSEVKGEDVVRVAQSLLNVSYLWGRIY